MEDIAPTLLELLKKRFSEKIAMNPRIRALYKKIQGGSATYADAETYAYGNVADLQGQITTLTGERDAHAGTIAQLQNQIKEYQTADLKRTIAKEKGIPLDMASRLSGDDENALRADADSMAAMLRVYKGPAPRYNPDSTDPDGKKAGMETMLRELRGE